MVSRKSADKPGRCSFKGPSNLDKRKALAELWMLHQPQREKGQKREKLLMRVAKGFVALKISDGKQPSKCAHRHVCLRLLTFEIFELFLCSSTITSTINDIVEGWRVSPRRKRGKSGGKDNGAPWNDWEEKQVHACLLCVMLTSNYHVVCAGEFAADE